MMGHRIRLLAVVPTLVVALGVLASGALALGACGGPGDADLPTAGGVPTAGTPSTAPGEYAEALAFAKCLRDNGLPDFPDPAPDGSFDAAGSGIDRTSTQYKNAMEACKDLQPGGTGQNQVDPAQAAQMTKYAKCMRDNGLPDFPDPGPNGFEAGALNPDEAGFAAASKACQEFLTWR